MAARALSRIVLEPVRGQLANKRLLIVSDGALQYIPFAALPLPGSLAGALSPIRWRPQTRSLVCRPPRLWRC